MAATTRVLTINAAFLQEIKEDNRELHHRIEWIAARLPAARATGPSREWVDALGDLRDQLAIHFALEEAFGYFEDALAAAPRLSERAEQLRSEHATLFEQVCATVDQAERWLYHEPGGEPAAVTDAVEQFLAKLHAHEAAENDLIFTAMNDELGVGD